ncbi:MAG: nucleotidyltransferase domain-containing protein [Fimbriimonadaceae bacterium]
MNETQVLETIRERLKEMFEIKRIVLFGSRARGDAKPDSDFDVLVIANSNLDFVQRQARARRAVGQVGASLDLMIYTPSEAQRAALIPGTTVYWAEKEGREVYVS